MKGTICKVGDFLKSEKIDVKLDINGEPTTYLTFREDRVVEIPMYQREIRWDEQQVNELLKDIMAEEKFLGNIFLSELGSRYELIDGQQRLTVLYIILNALREDYSSISNYFKNFPLIELKNYSFDKFYDNNLLNSVEDPFNQKKRYAKIHDFINSFLDGLSKVEVNKFCKNIYNSELNVILLEYKEQQKAINGFIDINVKGVKLDNEDILKGYFFRIANNSESVKEKWTKLKVKLFKLKEIDRKNTLELTDLFYNIIFCILRNNTQKSNIEQVNINKKFLLESEIEVEDKGKKYIYKKGAHVMDLINDCSTVDMILDRAIEFTNLNLMFYENNISKDSKEFAESFGLTDSDSSVREVCFKMMQALIRNNITVYGFLATYCFVNGVNKYSIDKRYCANMIYHSYFYSFLFDALASRKGVHSITKDIGNCSSFCSDLVELSASILKNDPEPRLSFAQKLYMPSDGDTKKNINGKFTVLHFASLFECFNFSADKSELKFNKSRFNYINTLTNEHFFINNCGNYKVGENDIKYTESQNKMKDSFINLVPFSENVNRAMGNMSVESKLKYLENESKKNESFWINESCKYTITYYDVLSEFSKKHDYSVEDLVVNSDLILNEIYRRFIEQVNI